MPLTSVAITGGFVNIPELLGYFREAVVPGSTGKVSKNEDFALISQKSTIRLTLDGLEMKNNRIGSDFYQSLIPGHKIVV
eukprot:71424-Amorphochlora_amoeboformis.AAC.1